MLKNIPTGVEIVHNEQLTDQLLIEIPHSRFHLHGLYDEKEDNWEISILDQIDCSKRKICKNIKPKDFGRLITSVLAHPEQTDFKKKPGITKLRNYYKSIIKGFKA